MISVIRGFRKRKLAEAPRGISVRAAAHRRMAAESSGDPPSHAPLSRPEFLLKSCQVSRRVLMSLVSEFGCCTIEPAGRPVGLEFPLSW